VGEDEDELLAPVARGEVGRTVERRAQDLGHADEALVPRQVSVGVVVALEEIDVAEDEGEGHAVARGAPPLLAQRLVEAAAVGEPGERVEGAEPLELLVRLEELAPDLVELGRVALELLEV